MGHKNTLVCLMDLLSYAISSVLPFSKNTKYNLDIQLLKDFLFKFLQLNHAFVSIKKKKAQHSLHLRNRVDSKLTDLLLHV